MYIGTRIKNKEILLDEINSIDPSWKPIPTGKISGRKKAPSRSNLVEEI